jgi:hypothetical protein
MPLQRFPNAFTFRSKMIFYCGDVAFTEVTSTNPRNDTQVSRSNSLVFLSAPYGASMTASPPTTVRVIPTAHCYVQRRGRCQRHGRVNVRLPASCLLRENASSAGIMFHNANYILRFSTPDSYEKHVMDRAKSSKIREQRAADGHNIHFHYGPISSLIHAKTYRCG